MNARSAQHSTPVKIQFTDSPLKAGIFDITFSSPSSSSSTDSFKTRLMECLMIYRSSNGNSDFEDIAVSMHDDLHDRSLTYFKNRLLLAATYLDPRYRSLLFIKDDNVRSGAIFDASSYIKNICIQYWLL